MDFLALPRRDLQALCKRNGVRANMTSAAMADALRALPKVDGIEEYFKQPVPVSQPEVESVVEEEQDVGKREGLPPRGRGRRTVAKSSEPIETKEVNEEEKGNAKRQSSKEDAPALGVARRGASRRAVPAEEEGPGEEDLKREAKKDNAPAPVAGRRGASRRGRPSPATAAQAAESEVAGAEEEKRVEAEDPKREESMDDVPALGVGRRGANRRARAAPSVAAMAGKVVGEEEQGPQIPCGRRVRAKGTSSEPIRLDDSDDEEKEDAKPEEQKEDAQILGVGRRGGASRRAPAAPAAAAAPEAKAEEEQRAPVPRGRRGKANSAELIRMDGSEEHTKQEEEKGDVPTIAVGRHGASRRAPAPSEAPATRRSAAASKADAGDVAMEAAPIRATRQRKPTMKAAAAAAAEEKAPRRGTRRGEVMSSLLQKEVHEEPHEAVGAPNMAVEAVPIRSTRQRKPTMKAAAAVTAEEKLPPRATRRGAVMKTVLQPEAQEEPQEAGPVSHQRCDATGELADASDPQKKELNEVVTPTQVDDQDVIIIDDEKLMEETITEEPSVTHQEWTDNSEMQQQVDDEKCHALGANHEESPILGLVSTVIEQGSEDTEEVVDALVSHQRCDAMEELADASDPQKEELIEENSAKQDEDQDLVITEDEKLRTPAEEASVTDQECTDKSKIQEQLVDDEKCHRPLANLEESPIGLISTVAEQASEDGEEVVDAEVSHQRCDVMEGLADASGPQKEEFNEVDTPKQDDNQDVVINEDEMLMEETPADDAQDGPKEAVGALVSFQRCDDLEELAEASDPRKGEVNEANALKQDQDQDLVITEVEMLMEDIPTEEPAVTYQEWTDNSEMQELVDDEKCHALLANHEESPILGLVSTVTEQGSVDTEGVISDAEVVDALDSHQRCDAMEELADASDPQKEELNEVNSVKQDEDQDLVITEDEKLMEETPAEEAFVTDQECTDKSEIEEQLVDGEKCHAPLANNEELPIGLVSTVTEQASEDSEEVVDASVSHQRCDAMEGLVDASDPQKEEFNEVEAPKQDVVINEDEMLMEETPAEESSVTNDAQEGPKEAMGALVSFQRCDDLVELAEASDPQKEEANEVNALKQDQDQDLVIIEVEKLMEEASVTDQECMDKSEMLEQLVDDENCHAIWPNHEESPIVSLVSTVTEQGTEDTEDGVSQQRCDAMEELADASDPQKEGLNEVNSPKQDEDLDVIFIVDEKLMEETIAEEPSMTHQELSDNSEMEEQQVEDEKCHDLLASHKESPILGLVSTVTEQASQDEVCASFQDDGGSCSGLLDKDVCEKTSEAYEEMEWVPGVQTLEDPLTGNESDASEVDIALLVSDIVDEAGFLDCSSNISQVAEEISEKISTVGVETNEEINTEDGLGCQEECDVVVDKVLHDWKGRNVTSEMPENRAALDEDGDEQMEVTDKVLELTESNVENVGEKKSVETMAVLEEMGVKVANEREDLSKLSLAQLRAKYKEKMIAKKNKEAKKRVALGSVDGNVCRSHPKRQQQNLNLQLH